MVDWVVWGVFGGRSGFARVSHPVFHNDGKTGATETTVLFGTDDTKVSEGSECTANPHFPLDSLQVGCWPWGVLGWV